MRPASGAVHPVRPLTRETLQRITDETITLIAHPTGSGKTRLGILWQPDLVVAPAHLVPKWNQEARFQGVTSLPVVSYQGLYRRLKDVRAIERFGRIAMDEVHALRGMRRMGPLIGAYLRADKLLALTATPASISPAEIENLRQLGRAITGASELRVIREELPPPELPALEVYYWMDGIYPLDRLSIPHRMALHAIYPADADLVRQMVNDFSGIADVERVALFSSFRGTAERLGRAFNCPVIDGRMKPEERVEAVNDWRASSSPWLSLTWQSAGIGLDLPEADLALLTDVPDTPLVLDQVVGRLRRPGRLTPAYGMFYCPPIKRCLRAIYRLLGRQRALSPYSAERVDKILTGE